MSEAWAEHEVSGLRFRYRPREGSHPLGSSIEVEKWHEARREWREVRSLHGRAWLEAGLSAGRAEPGQGEASEG